MHHKMRLQMHTNPAPIVKPNATQSASGHLNVASKSLSDHLSLYQISSRLGLLLLFGLDDVEDSVVGSAIRSVTSRCVAPSGGAPDLGHLGRLWGLDTSDHGEGVLERPADDHGPEAFASKMVVHVLDRVGHVYGIFASAFGAGVLGFVSRLYVHISPQRTPRRDIDLQCTRQV